MKKFDFLNSVIIILIFGIVFALGFVVGIERGKQDERELISPISKQKEQPPILVELPTTYSGKASFYNQEYCDLYDSACITASGDVFDDTAFTTACSDTFKLGSRLRVIHKDKSIEVVCNDRGSFKEKYGRILDLSEAAFEALASTQSGVIAVTVEEIK